MLYVFEADDDMIQPPNSAEPHGGRGSGMILHLFMYLNLSSVDFQACHWLLWEQHHLLIRLVLISVSVCTGVTPRGLGLRLFSFLQDSYSELVWSWVRQVSRVA